MVPLYNYDDTVSKVYTLLNKNGIIFHNCFLCVEQYTSTDLGTDLIWAPRMQNVSAAWSVQYPWTDSALVLHQQLVPIKG